MCSYPAPRCFVLPTKVRKNRNACLILSVFQVMVSLQVLIDPGQPADFWGGCYFLAFPRRREATSACQLPYCSSHSNYGYCKVWRSNQVTVQKEMLTRARADWRAVPTRAQLPAARVSLQSLRCPSPDGPELTCGGWRASAMVHCTLRFCSKNSFQEVFLLVVNTVYIALQASQRTSLWFLPLFQKGFELQWII